MRAFPILSACLVLLAVPAFAASPPKHPKTGPQAIGTFEDWTAAVNKSGGQTVCYAFARPHASTPTLPGRGSVVFTVTERSASRDEVAISVGFAFAPNATATLDIHGHGFDLYTGQRSAFARDGHAVVEAMIRGSEATTRVPGPKGKDVADTFSLRGFDKAYAAIVKRCPAGKSAT